MRRWNGPEEVLEELEDEDEVRPAAALHLPGSLALAPTVRRKRVLVGVLPPRCGVASSCFPLCLPLGLFSRPSWVTVQVERYAQAVRSFQLDQHLAPYDLASWNRWRQLAGHISGGVVDALQPVGGNINILAEADPSLLRPATAAEEALYEQLQKGREAAAERQQAAAEQAGNGKGVPAATAAAAGDQAGEAMVDDQQPTAGAGPAAAAEQQQEGGRWAAAPHAGRCFYTPLPRLVKRGGLTPQELTGASERSRGIKCALAPPQSLCPLPTPMLHLTCLLAPNAHGQSD